MHFLTGSARCDLDSDVVSLGVLEKPAKDWSEALAIVVREVVIVWGRGWTQPEQYHWYCVRHKLAFSGGYTHVGGKWQRLLMM